MHFDAFEGRNSAISVPFAGLDIAGTLQLKCCKSLIS